MTEVFTHVISSTGLNDESKAGVSKACPRELLGLRCIASAYACLCELADASTVETVDDENGEPALVNLTLSLNLGIGEPLAVMYAIDLTGYRADFDVSRHSVVASFNLRRPENTELRSRALDGI